MSFKLSCLCDCGFVARGADRVEVGAAVRTHLDEEHQLPADPSELAACALPAYAAHPTQT
ncbi:Protein of unknown function [Halogranum gelatinilyticum]|uniref:DUF1059 domain-containing protein n=1 Tax=Halogranum gelatinilyticum TaxID=660521 RepID=A0A1H0A484_9EURY|nr:DUF1059 domain-containing protein [Halogranum gelatinilyticum]SDN27516.1 Protein of unknown function [Halogranum gelatinilyticum]